MNVDIILRQIACHVAMAREFYKRNRQEEGAHALVAACNTLREAMMQYTDERYVAAKEDGKARAAYSCEHFAQEGAEEEKKGEEE